MLGGMTQQTWEAIVIGGGPAGLSAAQALGRSLRRTLVIDSGSPRNRFAAHMHNILGHDGVPPADLAARGRAEAASYGVEFREGSVRRVRDEGSVLSVELAGVGAGLDVGARAGAGGEADGERLLARRIVVATGVADRLPEIPGLAEYWGRGVLHCPYCHGWEVRGKRIAIVTLSPLGMHHVKLLRQWTDRLVAFTSGAGEIDSATERSLANRGIVLETGVVSEIVGDGTNVTAVRTADGAEYAVDAVFTMGSLDPRDGFLDGLGLERAEGPAGSFLAVDPTGCTSDPRIWAVGNVSNPMASVPMAAGAGNFAGGAVNASLVEEDFELAALGAERGEAHGGSQGSSEPGQHGHAAPNGMQPRPGEDPAAFWERRYADADRVWSGRVNRTLADIVDELSPGRSLDLGCGEGGDVLWLAERGWDATGVDLSPTAVGRAEAAAAERGLGNARFVAADLADWVADPPLIDGSPEPFDLVTASFLQSPVALPRERILRAAADRVAPGGRLVLVSHAAAPRWAEGLRGHGDFPQPESELAALRLDPERWTVLAAEVRTRDAVGPDGAAARLDDTVVVARRLR